MFTETGSSLLHRSRKGLAAALSKQSHRLAWTSKRTMRWPLWVALGLFVLCELPSQQAEATPLPSRARSRSSKKAHAKKRTRRWLAQRLPRGGRRGRRGRGGRPPRITRPGTIKIGGGAAPGASSIGGKAGTTRVIGGLDNCRFSWRTKVRPDFKKADVLSLVKWIAKQTCQNFIVSDKVRGRPLYIISESDVTLRDAYRAFFTALRENQMIALRVGRFWKVIGANEGRQSPVTTITNENLRAVPGRDEMVTFLYRLKHLDPNKVSGLLRQLVTAGSVIPYQASNVLIITDYGPNIRRVINLIRALDVEQAETKDRLYILQVRYAQAQEIAGKIQQLFQVGNAARRVTRRVVRRTKRPAPTRIAPKANEDSEDANRLSKIVADERTNQLIVLCNPRALKRVSKLVTDLDIPLPDDGQIRVYNLKFASADELAQVLSQLTQGTTNNRTRFRGRRTASKQKKASELFEGEVKITADKATNSLVVVASRRDYENLSRIIEKLDIARKQVFVEIVILEVSVNKTRDLGLTFSLGSNVTGDANQPTVGLLGTQLGGQNSLILDPTALTGLAFGLQGAQIPGTAGIFGQSGIGLPSFSVLIRALQTNTDVDVLSTPHILTTANEEATLQVGQNVPFIAGTTFTGGVAGVPAIRNIQRQDVALTLKLKPQIDAGSYIRIDFEQELTELAAQDPELGPTTAKRKIKTVVLAKDRQTIVIGGLIRDKVTNGVSKVPVLGDIPLLGALFRVQNRVVEKRNLLVFMTPYVINSMYDFRQIFQRKMEERQKFLDRFYAYARRKVKPYVREDRMPGLFERVNSRLEHAEKQAKEMETKGVRPVEKKKQGTKKSPQK
ncbi:MAG: type II secretion system secretin GspD [Myxococcales bacterium]|nr:type II secretion system secretin GspD [Myxococcales bacterium]